MLREWFLSRSGAMTYESCRRKGLHFGGVKGAINPEGFARAQPGIHSWALGP